MRAASVRAGLALAAALLLDLAAPPGEAAAQPYLEVDPFAYPLGGFSIHAGHLAGPLRFEAGAFSLRAPSFLLVEEGWSLRVTGVVADADYLGEDQRGWFVGLVGSVLFNRYTLDATGERAERTLWSVGPRAGYLWYPGWGEHFYLAPWGSAGVNLNPEVITAGGRTYPEPRWQPFLTVHLGWRF
jgi:hypothetical protein